MSTLYVLQLENGKWYVGKTTDISRRYAEHKSGDGSEWTKIYKPIKITETRQVKTEYDENNLTKDLMKKYGIENVRGGAYSQVVLGGNTQEFLERETRATTDSCFECGEMGHFMKDCPTKTLKTYSCKYCNRSYNDVSQSMSCQCKFAKIARMAGREKLIQKSQPSIVCYRCGRPGHYSPECYSFSSVDGQYLGKPPYDPRYDYDSSDSDFE